MDRKIYRNLHYQIEIYEKFSGPISNDNSFDEFQPYHKEENDKLFKTSLLIEPIVAEMEYCHIIH